jgi:hypothetical protein
LCSIFEVVAQTCVDCCVRKKLWKTLSKVREKYA